MANGAGYVAQYGPSIRRLAALDLAAAGDPNLAAGGPQPNGGLPDIAPQMQPQPRGEGVLPMDAAQPQQQGVLSQPQQSPFGDNMTPQSIWMNMGRDERKKFVAAVEKKGVNIAEKYDKMVKEGQIVPPERYLTKGEKITAMAEVLLRHARNQGAGMPGGAAAASAMLETDQRRAGQLQAVEAERARGIEVLRQEERGDEAARVKRQQEIEDKTREQRNKEKDALREREFKNKDREDTQAFDAEENKKQRDAAAALAREQAKKGNVERFVDDAGNVWMLDKNTNKAAPVEAEMEVPDETPGFRGRPPLKGTKKVTRQLKGVPGGSNANGLDQDKVVWAKTEAEKMVRDKDAQRAIQREARAKGVDPEVLTQQKVEEMTQRILSGQGGGGGPAGNDPLGIR